MAPPRTLLSYNILVASMITLIGVCVVITPTIAKVWPAAVAVFALSSTFAIPHVQFQWRRGLTVAALVAASVGLLMHIPAHSFLLIVLPSILGLLFAPYRPTPFVALGGYLLAGGYLIGSGQVGLLLPAQIPCFLLFSLLSGAVLIYLFVEQIQSGAATAHKRTVALEQTNQRIHKSEQDYRFLFLAAQQQATALALLDQVRLGVMQNEQLDQALEIVIHAVAQSFGEVQVGVYIVEQGLTFRQIPTLHGLKQSPVTELLCRQILQHKAPVVVGDVDADPQFHEHRTGLQSLIGVPLPVHQDTFGIFVIASKKRQVLTEQDMYFAIALSEHIVMAVQLDRLRHDRQRAEHELLAERSFTYAVLDSTDAMMLVLHRNRDILYVNDACSRALDVDPDNLKGRVFHEVFGDATADDELHESMWRTSLGGERVLSWSYTPLQHRGGDEYLLVTGIDITEHRQAQHALHHTHDTLQQRVDELEQRTQELALLNQMSEHLQSCDRLEQAVELIAKYVPLITNVEHGIVYLAAAGTTALHSAAVWGELAYKPHTLPHDFAPPLPHGRPTLVQHTIFEELAPYKLRPMCMPLLAQNEVIGLLVVFVSQERTAKSCTTLLVAVAEQIALVVSNIRLRETLQRQALIDPLTNLYNRRYLSHALEREIYKAKRHGASLGVVMLDIDHFKRFNDAYGHAAGDYVLQTVSAWLESRIRLGDVVCRYGGEELTLIMPDASLPHVQQRAEQLRREISVMYVEHEGVSLGRVTVSFGLAVFPDHASTPDALLRAADEALYRAKQLGRNRVEVSTAQVATLPNEASAPAA